MLHTYRLTGVFMPQPGGLAPSTLAVGPSSLACASSPPHHRKGGKSCTVGPSRSPSCGRTHMACRCQARALLNLTMGRLCRQHLLAEIELCLERALDWRLEAPCSPGLLPVAGLELAWRVPCALLVGVAQRLLSERCYMWAAGLGGMAGDKLAEAVS